MAARRTHVRLVREGINRIWKNIQNESDELRKSLEIRLLYHADTLVRGVYDEDNICNVNDRYDIKYKEENFDESKQHHHNPISHFYNPVTGRHLNILWTGKSARDYAERIWINIKHNYCIGYYDDAFYSLGRLVHLLQDMSVPAHTHLDKHPFGDSYEMFLKENDEILDAEYFSIPAKSFPEKNNSIKEFFNGLAVRSYEANNFNFEDLKKALILDHPALKPGIEMIQNFTEIKIVMDEHGIEVNEDDLVGKYYIKHLEEPVADMIAKRMIPEVVKYTAEFLRWSVKKLQDNCSTANVSE